MPGFHLHFSNRTENLAGALAGLLWQPAGSPLAGELIIVPNWGMEKWLSLEVAERLGICANVRFCFLRTFTEELFRRLSPDGENRYGHFSITGTTWRLFDIFASKTFPLAAILDSSRQKHRLLDPDGESSHQAAESSDLFVFQFAQTLAEIFNKYLLFRPDMIRLWDKREGESQNWQEKLWRLLFVPRGIPASPLTSLQNLVEKLNREGPGYFSLPPRLHLVNPYQLPPFYRFLLEELARFLDIHLYVFNPCREYWLDLRSEGEIARRVSKITEPVSGEWQSEWLHWQGGNFLLTSLGKGARFFHASLMDMEAFQNDHSENGPEGSILQTLQQDIFSLKDRGRGGIAKIKLSPRDLSLQIHCCHSPVRELEILHDAILELLETQESLNPVDILVLAPDISPYVPYVPAVFSPFRNDSGHPARIPYSFAAGGGQTGPLTVSFLKILSLLDGRHEGDDLLSLLSREPIRRRLDLSLEEVHIIHGWVKRLNILWGRDATAKLEAGFPPLAENTWQAGLDRLLLAYAVNAPEPALYEGVRPLGSLEGPEAETLGKFLSFLRFFFAAAGEIKTPRRLWQWSSFLVHLMDLLEPGDARQEEELGRLKITIASRMFAEENQDCCSMIDFDTVRHFLTGFLKGNDKSGFFQRGVTFGDFGAFVGVPRRVIWLLGMNHDAFPRREVRVGYDLTRDEPRPGDPSVKEEDRYHFLETLMAARDVLGISHVGRSHQDEGVIPPAAPVAELIDYLSQTLESEGENGAGMDGILKVHPRFPFDPAYFGGEPSSREGGQQGLFSYSRENFQAAQAVAARGGQSPPRRESFLPLAASGKQQISLVELIDFYRHPTRHFLQRTLGVRFTDPREELLGEESFDLNKKERFRLGREIFAQMNRMIKPREETIWPYIRAIGMLPQGTRGWVEFRSCYNDVARFYSLVEKKRAGRNFQERLWNIRSQGIYIRGVLQDTSDEGRLVCRYAPGGAGIFLDTWIEHVMSHFASPGAPGEEEVTARAETGAKTVLLTADGAWEYGPLDDPAAVWDGLVGLYLEGLTRPLNFFHPLSWDFHEVIFRNKATRAEALEKARAAWVGDEQRPGLQEDPYLSMAFGEVVPLEAEFIRLAQLVYEPMMKTFAKI